MDAGCLQNSTLALGAATCCSSCCCNVPSTHGHCQILSNRGWCPNSIGFSLRHPRGILFGRRRRGRRSNVIEASIVDDATVIAAAVVAATVLPMCRHFMKKARPCETSGSSCSRTSDSIASHTMSAKLQAGGLSSASEITNDTTASLRLGKRDTTELQSSSSHSESRQFVLNSVGEDADIGEGLPLSTCSIGFIKGGTKCAGRRPRLVTAGSSSIPPVMLLTSADECSTTGLDSADLAVSGYSDVRIGITRAGLLADFGCNTANTLVPSKGELPSESEAMTNGVGAAGLDTIHASTYEPDKNQLGSISQDNELKVNGVSAGRERFLNRNGSVEGPNNGHCSLSSSVLEQSSCLPSSPSLSASLVEHTSRTIEDNRAADDDQTVHKNLDTLLHHDSAKPLASQTETESSRLHLPQRGIDEVTNGSCSLFTGSTEQDGNEVGIAGLDDKPCGAVMGQNGSVFSISGSPHNKSPKRSRRKQRNKGSLNDLWEEFLQVQSGSVAKVLSLERYETLYQKLLIAERIQDCLEVFESMDKQGILDMDKVYHTKFFHAFKRHQAVKDAFRFMKLIKNPSLSTYNQLLSVCVSGKNVEGAFEVLSLLEKAGLKADCIIYTTVISACAKAGKVDRSFQLFHEMVNNGVEPNTHTYGALIDGCARAGKVGKAFGVYGIMRSKKLKPDRVIFNSLITACGRAGAIERAFDVLSEMTAEPIPLQPNHVTIGALIKACTRAGEVSRAHTVYRIMQDQGIKGSTEAYTAAVHACSMNGDFDTALEIYKDMKNANIQADEVFFSALIDVAGHAGQLDACFEVLNEMKQIGLQPGAIVYNAIIGACSTTGNWERGFYVYKEMLAASLSPNLFSMNSLLSSICSDGQLKEALRIFQEMRHGGMVPNHITYAILLAASEKAGDINIAFDLYKKATSESIIPTLEICESIMGICLKQIWKLSSGPTPTSSLSTVAGRPFCQKCITWALTVYRETIRSGVVPTVKIILQLLGCLRLPRTAEDHFYGYNAAVQHENNEQLSLIDGFGIYDPRALALFEEAAALGVVPSFSFTDGPIIINAASMPVFIAEVCLLTLLKGFKHRNAAGARLPSLTILLAGEEKELANSTSCRKVFVLTRTSQAVAALLRRLRLNFHGNESSGKLKVTPTAIRQWLQPKITRYTYSGLMKQVNNGRQQYSLGRQIAEQQRSLRYRETTFWSSHGSKPPNDEDIEHLPVTNGSHLQDSSKSSTWSDQDNASKATDHQEIKPTPQVSGSRHFLSKIV